MLDALRIEIQIMEIMSSFSAIAATTHLPGPQRFMASNRPKNPIQPPTMPWEGVAARLVRLQEPRLTCGNSEQML